MTLANLLEKEELAKEEGKRDAAVFARAAHWRRHDLDRLPDDPVGAGVAGGPSRHRTETDHRR